MQFLKLLLVVLTVGLAVAFAFNNWKTVDLTIWGGLIAQINLPLLMFTCFLVGFVPTWLWHRAVRWRLRQRLATSERSLADLRNIVATPRAGPTTAVAPVSPVPPAVDDMTGTQGSGVAQS